MVAALNGHAIGGGLELALACDIRIAARGIRVGMPPAKLGLIYSHTGLARFIDVCGVANTAQLFFVGANVDAERARAIGLVNELVDQAELESRALELAAEIAANAPLSLAGNKRIIRALRDRRLPEDLERELDRAARVLLPLGGLPRGSAGLRREARAGLERALAGAPGGTPSGG